MTDRSGLAGAAVFLALLLGNVAVTAETATDTTSFTYSEDWDVVSAPPPPGPYRAVNLDPRIPGQDNLPVLPVEQQPVNAASEIPDAGIPAEALNNPPAAGAQALSPEPDRPAASLDAGQDGLSRPVPGHYDSMVPSPPTFRYQAPLRYPVQSGYPGYRNSPSMGYGYYSTPARRSTRQQVPPPPVYDSMINERPSYDQQNFQGPR